MNEFRAGKSTPENPIPELALMSTLLTIRLLIKYKKLLNVDRAMECEELCIRNSNHCMVSLNDYTQLLRCNECQQKVSDATVTETEH